MHSLAEAKNGHRQPINSFLTSKNVNPQEVEVLGLRQDPLSPAQCTAFQAFEMRVTIIQNERGDVDW